MSRNYLEIEQNVFRNEILKKLNKEELQTKGYKTIMELFTHAAIGSDIKGVSGTRWAMLNAVTEYVDHKSRARSDEKRFSNAQFGEGAKLKDQAFAMLTDA